MKKKAEKNIIIAMLVFVGLTFAQNMSPYANAGGPYETNADETGVATVMLDGSGSFDIDGIIISWNWNFNDITVVGEIVNVDFAVGTYTVSLLVIDDGLEFGYDATTVTVNPILNAPPVVSDMEIWINEDEIVTIELTGTDIDADDLIFSVLDGPVNGRYVDSVYGPDADFYGEDSFTYQAFDGIDYSEIATVTIIVASVNDAPIMNGVIDDVELYPLQTLDLNIAVFEDVDGDELIYSAVSYDEEIALVSLEGEIVTVIALAWGESTITFTADDNNGGMATSSFLVNVFILMGDSNFDSIVNIQDVILTVNYILGIGDFTPEQIVATDTNEDGIVNIQDVLEIINLILL